MAHRTKRHESGSEGYLDVACDSCGNGLEPVFKAHVDNDGVWESLQADKALYLRIDGGYGMFIDPIAARTESDSTPLDFILCRGCSIKLADENPWLAPTLKRYIDAGIGHTCDFDDEFVWVPYYDCSRSETHGVNTPTRRQDANES